MQICISGLHFGVCQSKEKRHDLQSHVERTGDRNDRSRYDSDRANRDSTFSPADPRLKHAG